MPTIVIDKRSRGGGGGGGRRLASDATGFDASIIDGDARVNIVSLSALKVVFGEEKTEIYTDEDAIQNPLETE